MTIHHICIQTNTYEESKKFYTEIIGFKLIKETKNFHGRDFNTWLALNGFMIELQTGKSILDKYNKEAEGITHFALYEENIDEFVNNIKDKENIKFKEKNGEIIYQSRKQQASQINSTRRNNRRNKRCNRIIKRAEDSSRLRQQVTKKH